jgi:myo-inositol-1(or 4)-monophosphatase
MQQVEAIIAAAQQAADLVQQMQADGLLGVRTKSAVTDLVTEADVASERLLHNTLNAIEPGLAFWGEESHTKTGQPAGGSYWLVDPIDGTVNFAHGLAHWAVNIALVRDGAVEVAVTVQSPWRRVFWARAGGGAWLREPGAGERRMQVSGAETLEQAFLSTGFPYHVNDLADNNSREFAYIATRCLGLRVLGAGALDIAQVAAGMLAGFWEGWLEPWDAAAGALMVAEAGGVVTDYAGAPWRYGGPGFVCTNGRIHAELLDAIRTARAGYSERLFAV